MTPRIKQLLSLLLAAAFLVGAAFTTPRINKERKDIAVTAAAADGIEFLDADSEPMLEDERLPPHMTVLIASLGTFRGLIVDILWYRANELKEEGQFHEANTLSQWITTLQPRFPVVWEFHAWNMAYNISVVTKTKEERWDWVNKGIKLLRDRGIRYNPRAVRLYKELSWIYFHKVGDMSDDAHWYYKAQVAEEWGEILGAPTLGMTTEQAIEEFRPIAEAPSKLEEVLAKNPDVQKLLDTLTALGYKIDDAEGRLRTIRMFGQLAMDNYIAQPIFVDVPPYSTGRMLAAAKADPVTNEAMHKLIALLESKRVEPSIRALLAFIRHKVLVESYRMKPKAMLSCMVDLGPLDWRHPCAHGLYWAREGTDMATNLIGKEEQEEIDYLNTFRQTVFALQSLMRGGLVTYDPFKKTVSHEPDMRFVDSYSKMREVAIKNIPDDEHKMSVKESYAAGHENFLLQSSYFSYLYGDEARAVKYWTQARDLYGQNSYNVMKKTYTMGFEEWILDYMKENIDTMMNARQFVVSRIQRAIEDGLANGRLSSWDYQINLAKKMLDKYNKDTTVTVLTQQNRRDLPPFSQMLEETYISYMQIPYNHPILRARVWKNTPLKLRQETFQRLQPTIYAQAKQMKYDPEVLYPAPEGYIIRDEKSEVAPDKSGVPDNASQLEKH